jgi:hypothetical protein
MAMRVESTLLFESIEQIYLRVYRWFHPRVNTPEVEVRFRKYANANSRIRLRDGKLQVDISDLLQDAPAPIHEALASILVAKLARRRPDSDTLALYRRYFDRTDVRHSLQEAKLARGRKLSRGPEGEHYDLVPLFEKLNAQYFEGLLSKPNLGWSLRHSRTTLGHYDSCHHMIILSAALDSPAIPQLVVEFILYHEMLHIKIPAYEQGARRRVHTKVFRAAERQFAEFKEAKSEVRRLFGGGID